MKCNQSVTTPLMQFRYDNNFIIIERSNYNQLGFVIYAKQRPSHSFFHKPCQNFASCSILKPFHFNSTAIRPFRYFKIQLNTIDITRRIRGINPTNSIVYSPEPRAEAEY